MEQVMMQKIDELKPQVMSLVDTCKIFRITNLETYQRAGEIKLGIKNMRKMVDEYFDPDIRKAHELHKSLCDKKKVFTTNLDQAEKPINTEMANWDSQERRRIAADQAKALEAQRKLNEEAEEKAKKLMKNGQIEKAQAIVQNVKQVAMPVQETKIEGMSFREDWFGEVLNPEEVEPQFLSPDQSIVNKYAKTFKDKAKAKGIRFYCIKTPVDRRKI